MIIKPNNEAYIKFDMYIIILLNFVGFCSTHPIFFCYSFLLIIYRTWCIWHTRCFGSVDIVGILKHVLWGPLWLMHISFIIYQKNKLWSSLISPSSTGKNAKIVRSDIMIGVRTPVPPLCMCEFMMALSSRLSTKKYIYYDL